MATERATFAAGCFWGVEAAFRRVPGVKDTCVGYSGGLKEHPSYREVCTGTTGHAECVQVDFDPAETSYEALLEVFWSCHDPTQVDGQGPDIGSQYRSEIFYHDETQEQAARASQEKLEASGRTRSPVATEITPVSDFWRAEEYHQRYFEKQGRR